MAYRNHILREYDASIAQAKTRAYAQLQWCIKDLVKDFRDGRVSKEDFRLILIKYCDVAIELME